MSWAERDPRVLGLVALGSMAGLARTPDEWSDHDFWVVVATGHAEALRRDTSWYPDAARIVFHFRETPHGVKVLYENGHLLEPAVFELDELDATRANAYRVLVDKTDIAARMNAVAARSGNERPDDDRDRHLFGQFLTNLLVAVGRWQRGERQSSRVLVQHAVGHLLDLTARTLDTAQPELVDSLDPYRRVELTFPDLADRLAVALAGDPPQAAESLLGVAQLIAPALFVEHEKAVLAVERRIRPAATAARRTGMALHHAQLAMPPGEEAAARRFYGSLLGMTEVVKPEPLRRRGGCWFRSDGAELHLGVETPFVPARKAHPGVMVGDIDELADVLVGAGYDVRWDADLPAYRRFYTEDPFGNRLEFLMPQP